MTIATYLSQFITAARTRDERKLWALAEALFVRGLGTGPLIRVLCNLQPAADFLTSAPSVQLLPNILVAAEEFMLACLHLDTLQVQLQLGRSALLEQSAEIMSKKILI